MAKAKQKTETTETETIKTESVNPISQEYDIADLYEEHKTHSAVMRFLGSKGFKTGDIAKFLNKRYQHVRNVLMTPVKKAD